MCLLDSEIYTLNFDVKFERFNSREDRDEYKQSRELAKETIN
jgi:hypothetical protein